MLFTPAALHSKRYGLLKTVYVKYDPNQPELMEKIEEHWRASAFCKREKVLDTIVKEWKGGNTKLILTEEVVECLKENLS